MDEIPAALQAVVGVDDVELEPEGLGPVGAVVVGEGGDVLVAGEGVAGLASVANALAAAGHPVEDLSLRQPTLDEVFLTLTGSGIGDDEDHERPAHGTKEPAT